MFIYLENFFYYNDSLTDFINLFILFSKILSTFKKGITASWLAMVWQLKTSLGFQSSPVLKDIVSILILSGFIPKSSKTIYYISPVSKV